MAMSVEEVTNLYLYGQPTRPVDLTNVAILRAPGQHLPPRTVNELDYMTNGAGRFVSAAMFEVVRLFFEQARGLGHGRYTDVQLANALGVSQADRVIGQSQYQILNPHHRTSDVRICVHSDLELTKMASSKSRCTSARCASTRSFGKI